VSGPGSSGASETFEQTTVRRSFDVWNEVPLVAQTTGMSCWAAAAAMLIGWRERLAVNPDEVARGAGRWSEFKNGLHPEDVAAFADRWGLVAEEGDEIWAVDRFRQVLDEYGPLWVGEASPGLHAVVITGLHGDGTPEGTHVRVNDPWPVGGGERYTISFRQLRENFDAASRLTGDRAHVLHSGGRGHRIADARRSEQSFSRTVHHTERIGDAMNRYGRAVIDVESLEVRAGDRYIDTTRLSPDPLAGHGGTGDNLYLSWNAIPDDATSVDVVVHLHGYSPLDATRPMLERKVAASGLDLTGRTRPTLAILPRGRKITAAEFRAEAQAGGRPNASRYTFPAITAQQGAGLERLIQFALATFGRDVLGGRTVARGRLIISAHSGAGQALESLVQHASARPVCNPHEVHIFDALYSPSPNIAAWVRSRVATDQALLSQPNSDAALARDGGGCRVIYGAGTQGNSAEVSKSFPASGPLRQAYRAEATRVEHGDIPRVFGRALLTSVRADLVVVPSRAKAQSVVQPLDFESSGLAADDDARAWLTNDDAARRAIAPSVRSWVLATDRSAIELLADARRRTHFLTEVNWQHQDFPKKGKTQTAETESLFNAMERVVGERRANSTATGLRYHNVDGVVVGVPGNGNTKLFPEAKDAFVRMRDAATADGVTLTILSAFRSAATQDRIKAGNKDATAVAQGTSSHTYGLAIDLALSVPNLRISEISTASMTNMVAMYRSPVYKWMALNGRRFGWFPYRREPWHWEYNPEGFKARFEGSGATGGALAYGAPTGLFDHYAPALNAELISRPLDAPPKGKASPAVKLETCGIPPTSAVDPATLVVAKAGTLDYDGGTMTTTSGKTLHLRGVAFYPATADGVSKPFDEKVAKQAPIVFIAHGNHDTAYVVTDRTKEFSMPSPFDALPSGAAPVPNHRGYVYFQQQLARMGIVSVSIDANETSGNTWLDKENISDRAEQIAATLKHFQSLHKDKVKKGTVEEYKDKIFGGHLDFQKVGLLGHSRGAEAVLLVPELIGTRAASGAAFKAVLSVAPTDSGATSGTPKGFAFTTILPAGDGDVRQNNGARFYDKAVPSPFKSQLYVHEANHNYFNVEWSYNPDAKSGSGPMNETEHHKILSVYGCAFFRTALLGHSLEKIITGRETPVGAKTDNVHVSAEIGGATTVEDHDDSTPTKNTLLQTITKFGYKESGEYPFSQSPAMFNGSFFGNTRGLVVQRSSDKNQFTSPLKKPTDLGGKEIWIRCAEVYTGSVPPDATGFKIGLVDKDDTTVFIDSKSAGGVPRPFDRRSDDLAHFGKDLTKTMLKTLRFPIDCFKIGTKIKTDSIKAIVLHLDRADNRALAFDQWQIV